MLNQAGKRKYLTKSEIQRFLDMSQTFKAETHAFCWVLAETGCRISEVLELKASSFDFEEKRIAIRCLKKRSKKVFRTISLSSELIDSIKALLATGVLKREQLWSWSRMTAYRRVREVMEAAHIQGACATPRGLRHGFAVRAVQANVPLSMVQLWLGHADVKTTTIYTRVMGLEERELASRTWTEMDPASAPNNSTQTIDIVQYSEHSAPSEGVDVGRAKQSDKLTQITTVPRRQHALVALANRPAKRPETARSDRVGPGGKSLLNLSLSISRSVRACCTPLASAPAG